MSRSVFSAVFVFLLTAAAASAADHAVVVGDNFFSPAVLMINVGDSVTWSNTGNFSHNVKADNGLFRSGNPSNAEWTFTFTFNTAGDFRYFCELHGAAGGIGMSGMIQVHSTEPPPEDTHVVFLPISGSARGGNNAFFRTFARVFNPSSTQSVEVGASFLQAGQNNAAAPVVNFTLAPREVKVFEDIVGVLLGGSGLGAIRFGADAPFEVTGRIFTDSLCASAPGGTFGQFLRGSDASEALAKGVLLNLEVTPEFRTNIGFANPSIADVTVTVTLIGPSGVVGGPVGIPIAPRGALSPTSLQTVFAQPGLSEKNLYLLFEAPSPVFAFASVLDNATTDSVYIAARPIQ